MTEGEAVTVAGWYDFAPLYEEMVRTAPPGSTLVEVGVFCGMSLMDLARKALEADKGLRVVGVDTFQGSPEFRGGGVTWNGGEWDASLAGELAGTCVRNLWAGGVLDAVTLVVSDSVRAARLFADASVWGVFLDGDHSEPAVSADVAAWRSKVAPGGFLAGHDYGDNRFGVKAAVDRLFPQRRVEGITWTVRFAN